MGPAQEFGTAFHELILEQELTIELTTARQKQVDQIRNALQKDSFARLVLQEARKEVIELWDDDQTGLPCKSRLDLWLPSEEMIVDVKTTSARNYREFLASCLECDYDGSGQPSPKRVLSTANPMLTGSFYWGFRNRLPLASSILRQPPARVVLKEAGRNIRPCSGKSANAIFSHRLGRLIPSPFNR